MPATMVMQRYATVPLDDLRRVERCANNTQLAEALGVTRRAVQRWQTKGIPWPTADKLAIAAGSHPVLVWGDAWPADYPED
jgi:transcriptional regulator with XRE-family HTH domain